MASELFVDTSGFYSLLVKSDRRHAAASRVVSEARRKPRRFLTSDYVLDETATLLKARGHVHLLAGFFDALLASQACQIEWTDPDRFNATRIFFLKHADQDWSFTELVIYRLPEFLPHEETAHPRGLDQRQAFPGSGICGVIEMKCRLNRHGPTKTV